MDGAALSKAVKSDLPSPKPNRRKRLAMQLAVLVVAVSVLGTVYWFTRPPELVWWTSPPIGKTAHRVTVLVPQKWKLDSRLSTLDDQGPGGPAADFVLTPIDMTPGIMRWMFRADAEAASMTVMVNRSPPGLSGSFDWQTDVGTVEWRSGEHAAVRDVNSSHNKMVARITYLRTNLPAFNRTYKRICNSLRIE
jgi:hypothetical protein